ncbi:MAG: GC-type dockerin domain-anchored protein [Phycisphaerales bacterium]
MMKNEMRSFSVCLLAAVGATTGVAQANGPTTLQPTQGKVVNAGHIYYNVASGERIVTMYDNGQTRPADTGQSQPVWSALVQNACEAEGYTTEYFFGVDNPGSTQLSTNVTLTDWGDLPKDTVIDCIQINWVVAHPDEWVNDTDTTLGVVGIEELAGQWTVWDADDGSIIGGCTRLPLIDFTLTSLPGNTPTNAGAGALTGWTADIDLSDDGTFETDLTFEIGDSDGDCQTASFCNNDVDGNGSSISNLDRNFDGLPDSDLDGDGLFDFSWDVRFYQPGMGNDFDSDSDTGTPFHSTSDTIGVSFGFPEGEAVDNGDGTWTWDIDEMVEAPGTGADDLFTIYGPATATSAGPHAGSFFFGGFACTGGLISTGGTGYTPPAMFQFVLYGPSVIDCCPADYNCDGSLDFFDVSQFITDFNAMDPSADFNNDGNWDFFDVSQFIQAFNAGCP